MPGFAPQLLDVGPRAAVPAAWAGGGPVVLFNRDPLITVYLGAEGSTPGDATVHILDPLGTVALDGKADVWAITAAGTAVVQATPGATGPTASPAQIAEQIALKGINVNLTGLGTIDPSGDATGATDTARLNNALAAASPGSTVTLSPGIFSTIAPIVIPEHVGLWGPKRDMAIPTGNYGLGGLALDGAIIKPVAAFAGSSVISMPSPGAVQSGGQDIRRIVADGELLPAGTVHGIEAAGAIAGVTLEDALVWNVTGKGLYPHSDGISQPDFWHVSNSKFSACGGNGVEIAGLADSWFTDCEATGNTGDDWKITNGNNSRFINCKGEFAGGASHGFNIIGAPGFTGVVTFINCGGGNNGGQLFNVSGTGTGTFRFINPFSYQGLPVPCNVTGTNLTPGLPFWFSLGTLFAYTVTRGRYRIKPDDELELDVQVTPAGANAAVTTFSNALPGAYQPATVRRLTMETGRAVTNGDPWPTLIVNTNGNVDVSTQLAILSTLEYNGSVPLD